MVYISIKLRNYPPHAHTYMYTFITEQVAERSNCENKQGSVFICGLHMFCVCSFSFLKAVREGVRVNWLAELEHMLRHCVDSIVLMFT